LQTLDTVSRRTFLKTASSFGFPLFSPDFQTPRFLTNREIEVTRHTVTCGICCQHLTDSRGSPTDIHHSKYVSFNAVYRMVALANRQRPDLVFLTGDYVTWSKKYIAPMADALRDLRARYGVFGVLGNHDIRVDAEAVTRALQGVGIQVLRNASARVNRRGESLWLSGVDEYSYGKGISQELRRPRDGSQDPF
jgi:hypothetical protein